jgi:P27 family predicted phage terminase small subunit
MARPRQPIDLLEARGKKHLGELEKEKRKEAEVKAPSDAISAPKYLNAKEKKKFNQISKQLVDIKIMTNLDCDAVARYIQSESKYLVYDKMVDQNLAQIERESKETGTSVVNVDTMKDLESLRDKALKQCRAAASDLGLTISSRCKLVVPKQEAPPKTAFDRKFGNV